MLNCQWYYNLNIKNFCEKLNQPDTLYITLSLCSDENFDVLRAEKILDEDHYGLRVVKERILEFIAVGNLTGNPEGSVFVFLVHSLFIKIVKLNCFLFVCVKKGRSFVSLALLG